jgi:peroxisomal 2,4-dienoyl-CoA reductase
MQVGGTPLKSSTEEQESPFRANACAGRVVLVTGGGSGIGFGIARQLGLHGAKVCVVGRREPFLQDAVKILGEEGIEAMYCRADVREYESVSAAIDATVAKFGFLDTIVNSAAGNFLSTAEGLNTKGFKTVLDIDTVGVFNVCQAAFPHLKESGRGVILNITATLQLTATWYQTHACAAKAAIDSLTRQFSLEWGDYHIRVNGIAPGPIADTPGMLKLSGGSTSGEAEKRFAHTVPMGRLGTKFDIGMAGNNCCHFVSPCSFSPSTTPTTPPTQHGSHFPLLVCRYVHQRSHPGRRWGGVPPPRCGATHAATGS